MNVRPLLVCALVVFAACTPRNIPGTQIPDTEDARAILNLMERYRSAIEARDAKAVQQLVSKSFRDNVGMYNRWYVRCRNHAGNPLIRTPNGFATPR